MKQNNERFEPIRIQKNKVTFVGTRTKLKHLSVFQHKNNKPEIVRVHKRFQYCNVRGQQ